jgi:phosphoenolpyruvate-protein kinase (PTS system EI component)
VGFKDGRFACRHIRNHITGAQLTFEDVPRLTPLQTEALDMFDALLASEEICYHMDLQQGDFQFLNNHVVLHARTEYEDFPEPERKRHLLRLWLSLPQGQALPDLWAVCRCAMDIRTIDVGADKALGSGSDLSQTGTSPLGLRAIRWSLTEPEIFLTQLRAILRASAHGQARIMIPMLAHVKEIDETLRLIEKAKQQLYQRGQAFNPNIQVGAMIEIPAAALVLPLFINRFDFLSIGTNDLIQYTLAIDRADHAVAHLYDPYHPAILNLLFSIIDQAKRANIPVAVCGEMAGDPSMTKLLLGMGLTDFSMHFSQLLLVKREILGADVGLLKSRIGPVLRAIEPDEQAEALEKLLS